MKKLVICLVVVLALSGMMVQGAFGQVQVATLQVSLEELKEDPRAVVKKVRELLKIVQSTLLQATPAKATFEVVSPQNNAPGIVRHGVTAIYEEGLGWEVFSWVQWVEVVKFTLEAQNGQWQWFKQPVSSPKRMGEQIHGEWKEPHEVVKMVEHFLVTGKVFTPRLKRKKNRSSGGLREGAIGG